MTTTPQQEMMRAFAQNLRDWCIDLRKYGTFNEASQRMIGRLEGLAVGLDGIATLAGADEPEAAPKTPQPSMPARGTRGRFLPKTDAKPAQVARLPLEGEA